MAVATPNGLITPIIPTADTKGLVAISTLMKSLASKAQDGKLAPHEFQVRRPPKRPLASGVSGSPRRDHLPVGHVDRDFRLCGFARRLLRVRVHVLDT